MNSTKNNAKKSQNGQTARELQQKVSKMLNNYGIQEVNPEKKEHSPKVTIIPTTPEQREFLDKKEKEDQKKKPIGLKQRILNQYRKKGYSEKDLKEIEEELDYYI